jgi:MFS family permease
MKTPKRIRPLLSISLILVLLAAVFFWPKGSGLLSIIVLIFGVGMAVFLAVRKDWQSYWHGKITRQKLAKMIAIKVIGVILALMVATLAGGWTGRLAGQSAWDAGWPEWAVIVAGILAGFAAGFAAGLLVRFIWGKLSEPKRTRKALAGEG